MKAFLLAAGFGERLRPLTGQIPKPLVPVVNVAVIEYAIMLIKEAGINDVMCNLHYKYPINGRNPSEKLVVKSAIEILNKRNLNIETKIYILNSYVSPSVLILRLGCNSDLVKLDRHN